MAVDKLRYSSGNSASTTLAVAMGGSDTTATLTSDTNFSAKAGAGEVIIDEGTANEELAYATGKSGSALTIPLANRGLEGGSAQTHALNASVKGILTAGMWNDLIDSLVNVLDINTGAVDTSKVLTTPASSAQGDILYRNASAWTRLPAGTSGQFLQTQGSGANPQWATQTTGTDGWTTSSDTWTYASATSFTIAGADRTAVFTKGTRLKLTQTSAKYFVVTSSSFSTDTTVNITGGTDYTLANAAITSPFYSYELSPQGYPSLFSWTPTVSASSGTITTVGTVVAKFAINGKHCTFTLDLPITTRGTGAGNLLVSLPVTADAATYSVYGTETVNHGVSVRGYLNSTTQMNLAKFDNTTIILSDGMRVVAGGTYNI